LLWLHHITTYDSTGRVLADIISARQPKGMCCITGKPYFRGGLNATTTAAPATWYRRRQRGNACQELLDDSAASAFRSTANGRPRGPVHNGDYGGSGWFITWRPAA
jgi:hypothetical protein